MKRTVLFLAIALVLLAVITAPALAAKPNLVFITHITSDGVKLPANSVSGFAIPTRGVPGTWHVLGLTNTNANPGLRNGYYGFYLNANAAQQAALTSYFVAKGWPGPYLSQIGSEISGAAPFFFLKAADGVYTLVDGFTRGLGGGDASLRIDDDYPASAYQYAGTLIGSNGATLNLTIVMKVVRMP